MYINSKLNRSNDHISFLLDLCLLLICSFLLGILQNIAHAQNKLIDNLALTQTQEKQFSLSYNKELQQLQVNGILEIGVLSAFEKMLQKHPESITVVFNSNGGNVYQARGLARIITSNELSTYVSGDCYSACTIAYIAGKTRTINATGKLGFHQYDIKSKILNHRLDAKEEQNKDLPYFESRISDINFVRKIFKTKNSGIWIPEHQDLLNSGVIHKIVSEPDR